MKKNTFKENLTNLSIYNFNLKSIYTKLDISHSYASELFKKEFGKTFMEWKKEKMIEESKKCLIDNILDINQLSRNFGYSNIKEFIRFFKKKTGFTPLQYRKKYITDKMPLD